MTAVKGKKLGKFLKDDQEKYERQENYINHVIVTYLGDGDYDFKISTTVRPFDKADKDRVNILLREISEIVFDAHRFFNRHKKNLRKNQVMWE